MPKLRGYVVGGRPQEAPLEKEPPGRGDDPGPDGLVPWAAQRPGRPGYFGN